MVRMIMELFRKHGFTLITGDTKQSRLFRLKNGVFPESVLSPFFSTFIRTICLLRHLESLLMLTILALFWNLERPRGDLSHDISTLSAYLQTWKLSHFVKTMPAAFHLNNRADKRELKVYNNNNRFLPFHPNLFYLELKLDQSLTFCHHLMPLLKKLSLRVTLLRRLVGSG